MKMVRLVLICSLIGLICSFELSAAEKLPVELKKIESLSGVEKSDSLYKLARSFIAFGDVTKLEENKKELLLAIEKSPIDNRKALSFEIKAMFERRLLKLEMAKNYIVQALKLIPQETPQAMRLFVMYAFIETDLENYMSAMESYLIVEKMLQKSKDTTLLVLNFSNIADLYIKNGLYEEGIEALNKVSELCLKRAKKDIPSVIYENRGIAYFYLNNLDSLQYYTHKLLVSKKIFYDPIIAERLNYMINMLRRDSISISQIKRVRDNPKDADNLFTRIHLIKAYLLFDRREEARTEILKLLAAREIKDPGNTRSTLYQLLAEVYLREKNPTMASKYYEKSAIQSQLSAKNTMKTGSILTFLKYDRIKDQYIQAQKDLDVKSNYLMLMGVILVMILLIIFFLYRSFQTRRRMKKLMYSKLNDEILFMNSHEVRKYLSNILGIIMVIQVSDDKHLTYSEMESALCDSAENLDTAIRDMVEKLKDYKTAS